MMISFEYQALLAFLILLSCGMWMGFAWFQPLHQHHAEETPNDAGQAHVHTSALVDARIFSRMAPPPGSYHLTFPTSTPPTVTRSSKHGEATFWSIAYPATYESYFYKISGNTQIWSAESGYKQTVYLETPAGATTETPLYFFEPSGPRATQFVAFHQTVLESSLGSSLILAPTTPFGMSSVSSVAPGST
jgi:hypothetical protein